MSSYSHLKRVFFGRPLPSDRLEHERLSKTTALAVLSSDAISSVAYATEQTLIVLAVLGTTALSYVVPISAVIVALLVLVALSYRQTVFAYPQGGGSYTVARANLGTNPGLVAAAALLTDYILTVAVSISGGVAAITSAYPALATYTIGLCFGSIALLMLVNLRGVRESGAAFSVPTYVFIVVMVLLIATGVYRGFVGHELAPLVGPVRVDPVSARQGPSMPVGFALTFLVLRAFAEGCVAMTGTEAISNGVSAFKEPSSRNAAITLGWMATILAAFFLGTSYLARHYAVMPTTGETILSQLGRHIFGGGALYYGLQYSTFAILVLAANTAFADFPRLASILAGDRYMPRQFAARGDRLAFSNGIIALAVLAMVLVWLFRGDTSALIPLYAIGVFVCFTLSQAGMVVHWLRERTDGWRRRALLNGLGAVATGVVSVVQVVTKFTAGAWIVVLIIPAIIALLRRINRHYTHFAEEVAYRGHAPLMFLHHTVVVPVNGITKPAAGALVYATTISQDVIAVYVEVEPERTAALREAWECWDIGVELRVLTSPYRSVLRPLAAFVDALTASGSADLVTIVVPEIVPRSWFGHLLHNKTSLFIRTAFLFRPNVVVTAVPYRVGRSRAAALLAAAVLMLVACTSPHRSGGTTALADRLEGRWDARFHLDASAARGADTAAQRERHGRFVFLASRVASNGDMTTPPVTYGIYDTDLSTWGLELSDSAHPPSLIALPIDSDSVKISFTPAGGGFAMAMRGQLRGDSVRGRWTMSHARGSAVWGTFGMVRRAVP